MEKIIGILLTVMVSIIGVFLVEIFKVNILIAVISAIIIFIMILILSIGYYVKQINNKIENNNIQIEQIKKDLYIDNRLIKMEKDIEWLKRGE